MKSIKGQKIGTHGVSVMPPKDLFGDEGMPQYGVDGKDNLVLVYDVRDEMPTKAEGKEVEPQAGLPTVKWKADAPADISIPKDAKKPTKLVTEKLVEGTGETVKKGDTVYVSYTGVTWDDGKVFDSSMKDGRGPFSFPVGQQAVIPGWDKAVEGAKVGDRLLVVVPPKEGYGKQARPTAPSSPTPPWSSPSTSSAPPDPPSRPPPPPKETHMPFDPSTTKPEIDFPERRAHRAGRRGHHRR